MITDVQWKDDYKDFGYSDSKAPYPNGSKYWSEGTTLEAMDDAANKILGGDWQMPSAKIWWMMFNASDASTTTWKDNLNCSVTTIDGVEGLKVAKKDEANTYIFLPAGGYFLEKSYTSNTQGYYWSNTAASPNQGLVQANSLSFNVESGIINPSLTNHNYIGRLIRPIRLVPLVAK